MKRRQDLKLKILHKTTKIMKIVTVCLFITGGVFRGTGEEVYAAGNEPEITVTLADGSKYVPKTEEDFRLYPDTLKDPKKMTLNSANLQEAVDTASENGGGTVTIPKGNFYFKPRKHSRNFDEPDTVLTITDKNYIEYHIVQCQDNVTVEGTLKADGSLGTMLFPVGNTPVPIDMFFFAELFEKPNRSTPDYLKNNHFRNFCIDGAYTYNYGYYNTKGKGFYFCLFRDCSWDNVTVMNTDGTGFGVDCPINSKITNCTAIACGKQASIESAGASGFGIGFGYSDDESMVIENCLSLSNRKFGFFFEHQGRFTNDFQATKSLGFEVRNCTARGNLYDLGGEMCRDLTYIDCVSEELYDTDPNPLGSVNQRAYYYGNNSKDYRMYENGKEIKVWVANKRYYTDVYGWFVEEGWFDLVMDMGIMYGYTDDQGQPICVFGQDDVLARAQIAVTLFRYCNPDKEWNDKAENTTPFQDNASGQFYTEAMNWAYKEGIFTGDRNPDGSMTGMVRPGDGISRQELALVLYRFAEGSGANVTDFDRTLYQTVSDVNLVSDWAADAIAWCYANGVLTGGSAAGFGLMPQDVATRGHAGKMIPKTILTIPGK